MLGFGVRFLSCLMSLLFLGSMKRFVSFPFFLSLFRLSLRLISFLSFFLSFFSLRLRFSSFYLSVLGCEGNAYDLFLLFPSCLLFLPSFFLSSFIQLFSHEEY